MLDGPVVMILPALEERDVDGNGEWLGVVLLPCVDWTLSVELVVTDIIIDGRPPLDEPPPDDVLCPNPLL